MGPLSPLPTGERGKRPANGSARIERIAEQKTGITADTALRLAKYFGNSAEFWLNLQNRFAVRTAERAIARDLANIEPRDAAA